MLSDLTPDVAAIAEALPLRLKQRWSGRLFVSRVLMYGDAEPDAPDTSLLIEQLAQLLRLDSAPKRSLFVLQGGLRAFAARHAYLCVPSPALDANGTYDIALTELRSLIPSGIPKELKTQANLDYPSEILAEFLFLGGALSAHNIEVLNNVGISRVIACAAEFVPPFPEKLQCVANCAYSVVLMRADICALA